MFEEFDDIDDDLNSNPSNNIDNNFDDDNFSEDIGGDFSSFGGGGGLPAMEKHNDLLKNLTDFSPFLLDLFRDWTGITWDDDKKEFVKNPLIRPIMNEHGAYKWISWLKTYARKNNIITKDEEK